MRHGSSVLLKSALAPPVARDRGDLHWNAPRSLEPRVRVTAVIPLETLRAAPKVLLHDHLDGGLRPATVIELARDQGYAGLPTTDAQELGRWFPRQRGGPGSLSLYLRGFVHTIAVMQTEEALERVAHECGEDLARDGVVYAEVRYAPVFHSERGLNLEQVVQSVERGFERAERDHRITLRQIICAMRDRTDSLEMAELAIANRERGVVGFDIAGEEAGQPAEGPPRSVSSFAAARTSRSRSTRAKHSGPRRSGRRCSTAARTGSGHGVRLVEDMADQRGQGREAWPPSPRTSATSGFPLELCPSSNVDTGAVPTLASIRFGISIAQRFRVTVNNRQPP